MLDVHSRRPSPGRFPFGCVCVAVDIQAGKLRFRGMQHVTCLRIHPQVLASSATLRSVAYIDPITSTNAIKSRANSFSVKIKLLTSISGWVAWSMCYFTHKNTNKTVSFSRSSASLLAASAWSSPSPRRKRRITAWSDVLSKENRARLISLLSSEKLHVSVS
jgi:hypothetical protein